MYSRPLHALPGDPGRRPPARRRPPIDEGFHAIPEKPSVDPFIAAFFFDPGDYTSVKDAAEQWWDAERTAPVGRQPSRVLAHAERGQAIARRELGRAATRRSRTPTIRAPPTAAPSVSRHRDRPLACRADRRRGRCGRGDFHDARPRARRQGLHPHRRQDRAGANVRRHPRAEPVRRRSDVAAVQGPAVQPRGGAGHPGEGRSAVQDLVRDLVGRPARGQRPRHLLLRG